ncbi:MAG: replicative helicase loader/inhibitor [Clostridiales bacterium]|nr:replicative helicase loader/inhibitor [Clostridiales bacterium]
MDKQDTTKILLYIKALFPGAWNRIGGFDIDTMLISWQNIFDKEPRQRVATAVNEFVRESNSEFPPSASQIYHLCVELKQREFDREARVAPAAKKNSLNARHPMIDQIDELPEGSEE